MPDTSVCANTILTLPKTQTTAQSETWSEAETFGTGDPTLRQWGLRVAIREGYFQGHLRFRKGRGVTCQSLAARLGSRLWKDPSD